MSANVNLAETVLAAGRAAKRAVADEAANLADADRRLAAAEAMSVYPDRFGALCQSNAADFVARGGRTSDLVANSCDHFEAAAAEEVARMAHEMVWTGTVDADLATFHAAVRVARFTMGESIALAEEALADAPEALGNARNAEEFGTTHDALAEAVETAIDGQLIAAILQIVDERLTAITEAASPRTPWSDDEIATTLQEALTVRNAASPTPQPKENRTDKDNNS